MGILLLARMIPFFFSEVYQNINKNWKIVAFTLMSGPLTLKKTTGKSYNSQALS